MTPTELEQTCNTIKKACRGFNDDKVLINTLASIPQSSIPALKETFQRLHNTSLQDFLDSETSGNYKRLLTGILNVEAGEGAAHQIHKAISGLTVDIKTVAEITVGR